MTENSRPLALVIDDSIAVRHHLSAHLDGLGFEVLSAAHGAAGLVMWRTRQVEVVFLDIEMPKLDGPTILRVMRAGGSRVPIVLVTGATETRKVASVIKLGANDYLPKPFTQESVRSVLERVGLLSPAPPGGTPR